VTNQHPSNQHPPNRKASGRVWRSPTGRSRPDDGSILIMVLVMMVIGALVVLPMITYASTVFKASHVQTDKARAAELARGGTWVALSDGTDLFNSCNGGTLPSALSGVSTTCQVVGTVTQLPADKIPYAVAAIQSDAQVPASVATTGVYTNPNSTAVDPDGWDDWASVPDWSLASATGKVWLPQLPVQATSSGGTRDTTMAPGTQEPGYSSCRVFFPGTFTTPITISGPAFFTSGVYYFTEPITLKNGADVVVGDGGIEPSCTTDFEAIANAVSVPDPLNMSGLGGTFVLGGNARIVVDDTGAGPIRFVMKQRYVSPDETSVLASASVSIVSVNGTHAPLVGAEVLGDDLVVPGAMLVPASTVGTDGSPLAAMSSYTPSVLTPKATKPDAPTNVVAVARRTGTGNNDAAATVTWTAPNPNGSLITGYTVTSSPDGYTCSTPVPVLPDTSLRPSCTVTGLRDNRAYTFSVVATNGVGTSPASTASATIVPRSKGGSPSPLLAAPTAPLNPAVGTGYSDGLEIVWTPPANDGGSPITRYRVTATPVVPGPAVTCEAWWDETGCVLLTSNGLVPGLLYDVAVVAINEYGAPSAPHSSPAARIDFITTDNLLPPPNPEPDPVLVTLGSQPAPVQVAAVAPLRVPNAILDLSTKTAATVTVKIAGYVSVPQGHVRLDAVVPAGKSVSMTGGVVAGQFRFDAGSPPATLDVRLSNPVGQKRMRLRSTTTGSFTAVSDAVVQINQSGSIAINSWVIQ
jgi:hypothetical protein